MLKMLILQTIFASVAFVFQKRFFVGKDYMDDTQFGHENLAENSQIGRLKM